MNTMFINIWTAPVAKLLQSCPTLCDPIDGSPPGSAAPGILQARTLEWVAISFSNAWKWKVTVKSLSHVQLLATPRNASHQAPPSMGFSRQEYWSGVPLPSPYLFSRPRQMAGSICQCTCSQGLVVWCVWTMARGLQGPEMSSPTQRGSENKEFLLLLNRSNV